MVFFSFPTIIIIIIIACIIYYIHKFLNQHQYSRKQYWEGRYGLFSQRMDWYTNYTQIKRDFGIEQLIKQKYNNPYNKKVLEMGCGNSTLSYDLFNDGFKNITAIDFSSVVIEKMANIYKNTDIKFQVCDFYNMEKYFGNNCFDIIIEKAGLDSIATKETSDVQDLLYKIFRNIHYILASGGIFFSFSSKNTEFWKSTIYKKLEDEKLFKIIQTKKTVCKIKENSYMNLYFSFLQKLD